jgi:hypothetical protein
MNLQLGEAAGGGRMPPLVEREAASRCESHCVDRDIFASVETTPLWSSGQSSWLHNGDALCFLWGTNWIYICYVEESRPPLWSSGQSSWLQIQMFGFDSRRFNIFWEVAGLERGPLGLMSTTEELLGGRSSGYGLENRDYGRRDPSHWPRGTLYLQRLTLTSLRSRRHSVCIFRSRTQATEFSF